MAAKGVSDIRIAAAIKRRTSAVRVRARDLGCPLPTLLDRRRVIREKTKASERKR
jgi:hypothetical protein